MRWWRRVAVAGAIVVAACAAVAIAGLPLYVFPAQGQVPADADLVYVIGPPNGPRVAAAERLRDDGLVHALVSVAAAPDPARGFITASDLPLCAEPDVTCESPVPFTTAGEARMLEGYARGHDVAGTVVLTFTPHVARTRYIFAKCSDEDVTVVGVDERLDLWSWAYQYLYQTAAFAKAWIQPCPEP